MRFRFRFNSQALPCCLRPSDLCRLCLFTFKMPYKSHVDAAGWVGLPDRCQAATRAHVPPWAGVMGPVRTVVATERAMHFEGWPAVGSRYCHHRQGTHYHNMKLLIIISCLL